MTSRRTRVTTKRSDDPSECAGAFLRSMLRAFAVAPRHKQHVSDAFGRLLDMLIDRNITEAELTIIFSSSIEQTMTALRGSQGACVSGLVADSLLMAAEASAFDSLADQRRQSRANRLKSSACLLVEIETGNRSALATPDWIEKWVRAPRDSTQGRKTSRRNK